MMKGMKERKRKRKIRLFRPLHGDCSVRRPDYSRATDGNCRTACEMQMLRLENKAQSPGRSALVTITPYLAYLNLPSFCWHPLTSAYRTPPIQAYHIRQRVADAGFRLGLVL